MSEELSDNVKEGLLAINRKPWLVLTMALVGPNQVSRISSWDFATEDEMKVFYKKVLPPGKHYLVPCENWIEIENVMQTSDNTPSIIKPN